MRNSNSKFSNSNSRKSGFTMVELMVVVVILSVLASIVFALSGRATASAHRMGCVSILRQYGVATTGYLSDNNNMMPAIGVNLQQPPFSPMYDASPRFPRPFRQKQIPSSQQDCASG